MRVRVRGDHEGGTEAHTDLRGARGTEDHTEAHRQGVGGACQIYRGYFFWFIYRGSFLQGDR